MRDRHGEPIAPAGRADVVTGEPLVPVDPTEHLTTGLWRRAEGAQADQVIVRVLGPPGFAPVTWGDLARRVRDLAAGLIAAGVDRGDRVALMSNTRLEWTIADLAILAVGAISVPLYPSASLEQCRWILEDSGAVLAIVETPANAERVRDAANALSAPPRECLVIEEHALDDLAARGAGLAGEVRRRVDTLRAMDVATIAYTSGTTGTPKGCTLTHHNLLWTARQTDAHLSGLFGPHASTLLVLPLAHIFARIIQFGCVETGMVLDYARSFDTLPADLQLSRPTLMLGVPRVFEKLLVSARAHATGFRRPLIDHALRVAHSWSSADRRGPLLAFEHALADRLVYRKLRAALGGRVSYCISGGGALDPSVAHVLRGAGITILEGYGLTETSAPVTLNAPAANRIGTVGRPLPGVEIRVGPAGEVLVRGANVFRGYWHDDDATRAAFDAEGWFHTGDLGALDADGYLRLTGRKKELIVTAYGKNVAPGPLEDRMRHQPIVADAMVVGDGRPFVSALVTLDADALARFAAEHGLAGRSPAELRDEATVRAAVQDAITSANRTVSPVESIRRFRILPRGFSEEADELTPTMKLKRDVIAAHFCTEIDALYDDHQPDLDRVLRDER
jgi:long-chain acyl-CoA synthetase